MANFAMGVTTELINRGKSAALGATKGEAWSTVKDTYKPVKLVGDSRYGLCADGDNVEGFVLAVDGVTVNGGYAFGTVAVLVPGDTFKVQVSTAYAVGDLLVAAANAAAGTANAVAGLPLMKKPGAAPAGTSFLYRVVSGSGTANTAATVQRV